MKKIQISLAALLLSFTFAMAQPATKHDGKHDGKQKEMVMQQLNLTDAQKAQMKTTNDDFRSKMKALKSDNSQTADQLRDQRKALAKAHHDQMENILTPDQKSKMKELKIQAKMQHEGMSAKHIDKMKKDLNLTDDQAAQLKSSQDQMKAKADAIRNDASLDDTAKKQQMKALHSEMKSNMDKVLTPEQKQQWEGMKKNHGGHLKSHHVKKMPAPAAS